MPVFPCGNDDASARAVAILIKRFRFGFRQHHGFHRLSLAVELIQLFGNHVRL
ncbi:hypothetical protein D3C87_1718000 [compost metagenome]